MSGTVNLEFARTYLAEMVAIDGPREMLLQLGHSKAVHDLHGLTDDEAIAAATDLVKHIRDCGPNAEGWS